MIKEIWMMSNGAITCFDENDKQVEEWQGNLLCQHLRKMNEANVVDASTVVHANYMSKPVDFWISIESETKEGESDGKI